MAKCSECGFLAKWSNENVSFSEAHTDFRNGKYYEGIWDFDSVSPSCFAQMADLKDEFFSDEALVKENFEGLVKEFLEKTRACNGFTSWIQGFSPKEHMEMKLQDDARRAERRHANISLAVAVFAAVGTAAGAIFGAYMTKTAATLEAEATRDSAKWQVEALQKQTDAQLEMTKMQIEAQKEIAKTTPPPQIIVRMPPVPTK